MTKRFVAGTVATLLSGLLPVGITLADNVGNDIDNTVDVTIESLVLTEGGSAVVTYKTHPTNGDGDNGCNLGNGESVTFNIVSNMPAVATSSNGTITFTGPGCGGTQSVTVNALSVGSSTFTLTQGTNTTGGTYTLNTATFDVTVNPAVPTDITPPEIEVVVDPAANGNGWHNTDVTVMWNVVDAESSFLTSGCSTTVLTSETAGTTLTCSATSEGGTASESVTIMIDKTAPVITGVASPAANTNGWNNTDVTVNFSCAESGAVQSGIDQDTVSADDMTLTAEGAGQSVASDGDCTDLAGNAAAPVTVSDIHIDKTAPEVTLVTPAEGDEFLQNSVVNADWSTSDSLSGIDTETGDVPSGSPIDTSTTGAFTFSVTATDLAGNTTTVSHGYTVFTYVFGGFEAPVSISSKDFKKTSTIPVKFKLLNSVTSTPVQGPSATLKVNGYNAQPSGKSNTANLFRFDAGDMQYIYNLSTKSLTVTLGVNTLSVDIPGVGTFSTTITIK